MPQSWFIGDVVRKLYVNLRLVKERENPQLWDVRLIILPFIYPESLGEKGTVKREGKWVRGTGNERGRDVKRTIHVLGIPKEI